MVYAPFETFVYSFIAIGFAVPLFFVLLLFVRVFYEYERGVLFFLGKYQKIVKPGLRFIVPLFQTYHKLDMRLNVVDVPEQGAITKDNVTVHVNAVLYFKVFDAKLAIIQVEDYYYAVSQLAQTTMRNVVGEVTLDELLSKREKISEKIKLIVDQATDPWGLKVVSVDLKHIELPENMKRVMAKAAEAERLRRAIIIRSDGDALSASKIAEAALQISTTPGALHLRTLQGLNDIASDATNNINFVVPLDIIKSYDGYKGDK
jgi:regulator of protease activity HflC (stomatin/prohibitin superfamily)